MMQHIAADLIWFLFGTLRLDFWTVPPLQAADLSVVTEIAKLTPAGLLVLLVVLILRGDLVTRREAERMAAETKDRLVTLEAERTREREATDRHHQAELKAAAAAYDQMVRQFGERLAEQRAETQEWKQQAATNLVMAREAVSLAQQNGTP